MQPEDSVNNRKMRAFTTCVKALNLYQYLRGGLVTNNRFVQIISNRKQKLHFICGEFAAIKRQLR